MAAARWPARQRPIRAARRRRRQALRPRSAPSAIKGKQVKVIEFALEQARTTGRCCVTPLLARRRSARPPARVLPLLSRRLHLSRSSCCARLVAPVSNLRATFQAGQSSQVAASFACALAKSRQPGRRPLAWPARWLSGSLELTRRHNGELVCAKSCRQALRQVKNRRRARACRRTHKPPPDGRARATGASRLGAPQRSRRRSAYLRRAL